MAWIDAPWMMPLSGPLDEDVGESLRAIPGVSYIAQSQRGNSMIWSPLNAAWIVERMARTRGFFRPWKTPPCPRASVRPEGTAGLDALVEAVRDSELRPGVFDNILFPYQRNAAARLRWTEAGHIHHPPGAGKTLAALTVGASLPGAILIVTPASVRDSWWRQIVQYTELDAHIIDPDRYARKGAEKLDGYLARVDRQRLRPVVVVGTEALRGWLDRLLAVRFRTLLLDEAHYFKQWQRRKFIPSDSFDEREWTARDIQNLSWAAEQLSRSISFRFLLTATPVPDRLRDAWSQLDLAEPGAWGKTGTRFFFRHCDAKPNVGFPGLNTKGLTAATQRELAQRWSFTRDRVPYEVTHALLPPKRRIVTKLPPERQDRPSAAGAKAIKAANAKGHHGLQEARQLEAASRKRTYMLETGTGVLVAGGKVLVTTGLVEDRRRLFADFERKLEAARHRVPGLLLLGFDGASHSPAARAAMREAYMGVRGPGGAWIQKPHPGPAIVIATTDVMLVGQDWQDTDHMLNGHIPWNHGEIWQLENRVARPGQLRPVIVEWVAAQGTSDEDVVETVLDKTVVLDVVAPDAALAGLKTSMAGLDDPEALFAAMERKHRDRLMYDYEYSEEEDG